MIRSTLLGSIVVLVVALAATVRFDAGRMDRLRTHAARMALAVSNDSAARDTTRRLAADSGHRIAERRVVQVPPHSVRAGWAPGIVHLARYVVRATVDTLHDVVSGSERTDTTDGVRHAVFHVRQEPYTVDADVALREPPDSGRMSVQVSLDSIPLDVQLRCARTEADGIRTATISAEGPSWARVRFGRVEQSPELCRSPALETVRHSRLRFRFSPVLLGIGRSLGGSGAGPWSLFVGAGITLGA